jgi:hypothetical protein
MGPLAIVTLPSRESERFPVNLPLEWSSAAPITVVTNWTEKLKE